MTCIRQFAALLDDKTITFTRLDDETGIVLDARTAHVMSLNESAAVLVDAIAEGARTDEDLVGALVAEYEVDDDVARSNVEEFLEELSRQVATDREE